MKKHAIIPIFIPHIGCNNLCVFCNQNIITARHGMPDETQVKETIELWLSTLQDRHGMKTVEVAFFGGSFTAIDTELQKKYLSVAKKYKDSKLIDKIHLSTRPDAIDDEIINILKNADVDIVELGVQSFDDEVLRLSRRGHTSNDVFRSVKLLKNANIDFGIQLMIGLPGDNEVKAIKSAEIAAALNPQVSRLYPTVVLPDTKLMEMLKSGEYKALSESEAIEITKKMYKILHNANIDIIRVGLKSTDLLTNNLLPICDFHPAFRQLVESEIAWNVILQRIKELNLNENSIGTLVLYANPGSFSNLIGHKGSNKKKLLKILPNMKLEFIASKEIVKGEYEIKRI